MITTKDFDSLTDDLESIFNEVSKTKLSKMVGPTIFDVKDTDRKTHEHLILQGVKGIEDVSEGQDFPRVTSVEGDKITWTQRHYAAIVPVTKDMRKFDLHSQIDSIVRSIVDDAWNKVEQDYADTLLYGTSSSFTNVYGVTTSGYCADTVVLFSGSHTSPLDSSYTARNLIRNSAGTDNPALSRDAVLTARKDALTHTDPNGVIRPVVLDTLVVAPSNEDLAYRIIESEGVQGTANRDLNPLKGKIKVVVWPHLETRSDATDTGAYYFMYDSTKVGESLQCLFSEKPSLDKPEVVYANKSWDYSIDYYYTIGRGFPIYIWGSTGAN